MSPEQLKIGSRFMVVLLFTALALPAWGASPTKRTMFGKVAIVAKSGGDYTNPATAMANVALWCGTPSAANPCLVKIMPGVYDLAVDNSLTMQPYVDIEGSGETTTIITSTFTYDRDSEQPPGVVNGADNAELRFLTIRDTSPYPYRTIAIANNGQSPKITYVTAIAGWHSDTMSTYTITPPYESGSCGVFNKNSSTTMSHVTVKAMTGWSHYGVVNVNSSTTMSNVIVTASGGDFNCGVENINSSATMSNVTVRVFGGMSNIGMRNSSETSAVTILVDRSTFEAVYSGEFDNSVSNGSNVTLRIGASKLIGTAANSGTLTCAASYNGDYVALGTNCKPLP